MSLNIVCITGNLCRDPELKATAGGMAVLKLSVAVNDRRKVDGEWTDCPNFFDVTVFGSRGESLSRFLQKGSKVAIEGKLRWSSWETPDGDKRSKVEIIADDIEFMSSRDGGGQSAQQSSSAPKPETYEDDIPF